MYSARIAMMIVLIVVILIMPIHFSLQICDVHSNCPSVHKHTFAMFDGPSHLLQNSEEG